MRPPPRVVPALLFCSGLCALVYQTAWQRSLRLVFGASTAASAAVLAVFLGGLGVGGIVLGRRAEASRRPLLLYGNLELGVAAAAAVSPWLGSALGRLYLAAGGVTALGMGGATLVRLAITAVTIGPAVVLMGGTLPAAARAVEGEDDQGRSRLALLYGVNTLGAVAGALLGTFVLFELFGIRLSLWIAALLNALVGVVARSIGRSAGEIPAAPPAPPAPAGGADAGEALPPPALVHVVAAGVGFAFLLLEIVWYRMLAPLLGGSTYTFGLVLAVALSGIGIGGWLYAIRGGGRPADLPTLAMVTALEGALVALPIALGDDIAVYTVLTRSLSSLGFPALVVGWTLVAGFVVLPTAFVAGYQFPLLFALLGRGRDRVAKDVGTLYAFNTAGSIVGSLLGGFVLIPRLGAVGSWRLVSLLLLLLALLTLAVHLVRAARLAAPSRARGAVAVALLVALGLALVTRSGPSAIWRHEPIGAGRVPPFGKTMNELRAWTMAERGRVAWEADGVETAVAMKRSDEIAFVVDGKIDGGVFTDRATQAGAGLLAAFLHPDPRRALVIGLGTGMTAGYLAAVPGMRRVDLVELEPSVVEIARVAARANHDVLSRPNVSLHFGDGREFVLASRDQYDLVVSEPSNPYRAGVSALYTREFYEAVLPRLGPGGIFVQWVQGYEVDTDTIRTIVHTLRSVMPHVECWQTEYGDLLFLSSRGRPPLDVARLRRTITEEPYRSSFARTLLVSEVEGLFARFVASDQVLREIAGAPGITANTDDLNALDYAFARNVGASGDGLPLKLLMAAIARHGDHPEVQGEVDWGRRDELRARAWFSSGVQAPELPVPSAAARERVRAVGLGCLGRSAEALTAWERAGSTPPEDDLERFVVGLGLADRGDAGALPLADRLASSGFAAEAALVRGHHALRGGDPTAAFAAALAAIDGLRAEPLSLCLASLQVLQLVSRVVGARPELAGPAARALVERPFASYMMDEQRQATAETLAAASGDAALCVRALGAHVDHPRWDAPSLERRLRCLSAAHHPAAAQARADLALFQRGSAGAFE